MYQHKYRFFHGLFPMTGKLPWIICVCLLVYATGALAMQEQTAETPLQVAAEPKQIQPLDNLGRDTPRSSFIGFLKATESFDYESAVEFMDLRNLPYSVSKLSGEELAEQLDFVIKRGMDIEVQLLSEKNSGQVVDGLPDYRDELGHIKTEQGEEVFFMQRVPGPDENFIWKISNASIARIPELYDQFSYPEWVEDVRLYVPQDVGFLGVELFKWVIIISISILLAPVFWLIGLLLSRTFSNPKSPIYPSIRKLFTRPMVILALLVLMTLLMDELGLGATAQKIAQSKTVITLVVIWIIFSVIDLARAKRRAKFINLGRLDAHILGRPMANALKLLTLIIASLVWLNNAGVEITALLAGLGVGGVALALALQKPIEDLLGAISIYSLQPVQTGDLCKYGSILGTIEEIGIRTTRMRTLADTLVSIPNSLIAHGAIENYSARKKMLYHPELPLRFDTSQTQMTAILENIGHMARQHEAVIADSVRVRFLEFSDNAMIIRARIYVNTDDFDTYLKVVGELNMGILTTVRETGAQFSQGARTVLLEQGTGPRDVAIPLDPGHPV